MNTRLDWRQAMKLADDENIASILLKLEQVPTNEVAIVVPPQLRTFRNPVSMRLLQRKAEDLGIDVTIVTQDEMTRRLCAEVGFGCYADVESFKRDNSRPRRLEQAPPAPRFGLLSLVAGLCLVSLVAFVAYFVLPAATITVTPASAPLALDAPVIVDQSISSVDLAAGKIPAHVVAQEVDGTATVSATGQRDVPNQPARGLVTLTNLTDQPLTVPQSTVLLGGKVAFFTTQDALLSPTIKIADTPISGAASVPIQAADPGEEGNVPVGAITAVQGPLASKVSVVNRSGTSGGSKKKSTYLSSDDQAKAKKALLDELRQQALDKIQGQIARNETFLPNPSSVSEGAVEELTYEESPEQVTGQTRLHIKVLVRGLTFQGDDVNQVVAQAMETAAQRQAAGSRLSDAPLTVEPPAVVANDGASVRLQVHATGRTATSLDTSALAGKVRGMSPSAARSTLLGMPGVGQADVQLWPAWVTKVPSFTWRIDTAIAHPSS